MNGWGNNIEHKLSQIKPINYKMYNTMLAFEGIREVSFHVIEDVENDNVIIMFKPPLLAAYLLFIWEGNFQKMFKGY